MYKRYLKPRSLLNDTDFLQGEFVSTLLESIGIDQGYVFSDLIANKFFLPGQLGNLDLMIPGVVDVRRKFLRLKNLAKKLLVWQLLSVLYFKGTCYETVRQNSRFADSYWYSLEQKSRKSVSYVLEGNLGGDLPVGDMGPGTTFKTKKHKTLTGAIF